MLKLSLCTGKLCFMGINILIYIEGTWWYNIGTIVGRILLFNEFRWAMNDLLSTVHFSSIKKNYKYNFHRKLKKIVIYNCFVWIEECEFYSKFKYD